MARGNPAMNESIFERARQLDASTEVMTLPGAVLRSAILVSILLVTAVIGWSQAAAHSPLAGPLAIGGLIGGAITALVCIFAPRTSPVSAPIYAAFEGLVLGVISAIFESQFRGIVMNAVVLSIGVLGLMLFAYGTRIIPVTQKFRIAVISATGAVALVYLVSIVMSFFGRSMPFIHETGTAGIVFSGIVVVIAAINLLLDFDFIERGVQMEAPRYMEWYAGFSLLLTLVWMYLEILRLLAKMRKSN